VQTLLANREGPVVAATDYVRNVPDQIRSWVHAPYVTLGTDGYGRSDARAELRWHFEVDRNFIALAALKALADQGRIGLDVVAAAMQKLGIDRTRPTAQRLTFKEPHWLRKTSMCPIWAASKTWPSSSCS